MEVANSQGIELPSTGGIGVIVIYGIGAILIISAVTYFVIQSRRKRK